MTPRECEAGQRLLDRYIESRLDAEVDLRLLQRMLIEETEADMIQRMNLKITQLTEAVEMLHHKQRMIEGMTHAGKTKRTKRTVATN